MSSPVLFYDTGDNETIFNEFTCFQQTEYCCCPGWSASFGTNAEENVQNGISWAVFAVSIATLIFYGYQTWRATCGWEEVYVCVVEAIKLLSDAIAELDIPSTVYIGNGQRFAWARYAEWLLTCPVILIHMSNLTGLGENYSSRTMMLLVSDIGCIVFGATSAMSTTTWVKVCFFFAALTYCSYTYYLATKIYIEAYHTVPKGVCRHFIRAMAWLYFVGWSSYPIMFILGPETFGHLSYYAVTISATFFDLMCKNIWGFCGHWLRIKLREHIIQHGDLRKKTKVHLAGQEMEVERFVDGDEEVDDDVIKNKNTDLQKRASFIAMKERMLEQGVSVHPTIHDHEDPQGNKMVEMIPNQAAMQMMPMGGGLIKMESMGHMGQLEPGRIIIGVPDASMVDFFRQQFAALPVPMDLIGAANADQACTLLMQAQSFGGCDFVLLHPDFLRDRSPSGMVPRLRAMGARVAAFGWAPMGPMRELIEGAGLDGWLEGPAFGGMINIAALASLVGKMQTLKKSASMGWGGMNPNANMGGMSGGMGGMNGGMGGMNGGMGGMNGGMGGMNGNMGGNNGGMGGNNGSMAGMNTSMGGSMGGMNGGMGGMGGMNTLSPTQSVNMGNMGGGMGNMGGGMGNMGGGMGGMSNGGYNNMGANQRSINGIGSMSMNNGMADNISRSSSTLNPSLSIQVAAANSPTAHNPLYNAPPSPPAHTMTPASLNSFPGQPGGGGSLDEAETLQQLMAEIARLKDELNTGG